MKKVILVLVLMFFWALNSATISGIKSDARYLCGEGVGDSKEVADRQAINDLLSQISVKVESSFRNEVGETNGVVSEECELQVKTYSSAKLYSAERLVDEENYEPEVYVLRYILREQLDNIFRERKSRVNSLIVEGELAEESGRVADALRNYYWAYALLPTIPDYQSLTYYFGERGESGTYTGLENKLNQLLSGIKFQVIIDYHVYINPN